MHAVTIRDGHLAWEERPDPAPGDHDLLVAVRAAGVNSADLSQRAGRYPAPPGWPQDVPGLEFAGEVVQAGSGVTRFARGDRLMALVGGGGQAQLATVPEEHALPVPIGLPWDQAGGFMEATCTAFDALFTQAGLTGHDRVLITGAAGGVGTAGVQLAATAGAHVVASVREPASHQAVRALGAAKVVEPDDVGAAGPYDVVLELVGAASLPSALAALASTGHVVIIGLGGGSRLELDLGQLMARRARLFASTLRARSHAEKAAVVVAVGERALPLLAAGRVQVPVSATFPMDQAAAAYERFAQPGKVGKIVLLT